MNSSPTGVPLDHLAEPRGDDVVLNNDVVLEPEFPDPPEPVFHPGKEPYLGAVLPRRLSLVIGVFPTAFVIMRYIQARLLSMPFSFGESVGLLPELSHVVAYLLYEALRLHVIGGERLVEVIADGDDRVALLVPALKSRLPWEILLSVCSVPEKRMPARAPPGSRSLRCSCSFLPAFRPSSRSGAALRLP